MYTANTRGLSQAAIDGNVEAVQKLLSNEKIDVNSRFNPNTPPPLQLAANKGHAKVCEVLLAAKADVNSCCDRFGNTLLHHSASKGLTDVVKILLKKHKNLTHTSNHVQETPLYRAAEKGHIQVVNLLLEAGANPSVPQSSLFIAASFKHNNVVRAILAYGTDVNAVHLNETLLCNAVRNKNKELVLFLLEAKADPNFAHDNNTKKPLHLAINNGDVESVRILLKYGADPTNYGHHAPFLHTAATDGHSSIVDLLLDNEAVDVNLPHPFSRETPLFFAAKQGHSNTIRVLVNRGANMFATTRQGYPPCENMFATTRTGLTPLQGYVHWLSDDLERKADAQILSIFIESYYREYGNYVNFNEELDSLIAIDPDKKELIEQYKLSTTKNVQKSES